MYFFGLNCIKVMVKTIFRDMRFDETKGIYVKLYLLPERHKDTKRKTQVSLFLQLVDESCNYYASLEIW